MTDETKTIRWHQGFRGGIEALLWDYRDKLEFGEEFPLSKEALRVDLLVLKKSAGVVIENDFGRMFRIHNILEYKSPGDGLTIDDYYKTIAYACLYKSLGKTVDEIPGNEITASIFRHIRPDGLFKALESLGAGIEKRHEGVYYVTGIISFPTQIVVTSELKPGTYAALRALAMGAEDQDARDLILQSQRNDDPGFRQNMDAVLQVSVAANRELYEQIRRNSTMCEALRELMKDEFDANSKQAYNAGVQSGIQTGIQANKQETAKKMIQNKITYDVIMDITDLSLEKLQEFAGALDVPLTIPKKS